MQLCDDIGLWKVRSDNTQGRIIHQLVRLKPQGPGPDSLGARYNENFPPLWAPKFLEEKIAVFMRGAPVAFKPQGPEGP